MSTVEAVGFDFIRTPELEYECGVNQRNGELLLEACMRRGQGRQDHQRIVTRASLREMR